MPDLADLNQEIEHTRRLIRTETTNLQRLEEQAAMHGRLNVPLPISNGIDQAKKTLDGLQARLKTLEAAAELAAAPLVYLHTFGPFGEDLPAGAVLIDWSAEFDRDTAPRRIPGPAIWRDRLWPELTALQTTEPFKRRGLIRVRPTAALSAGFALGKVFSRAGKYRLDIWQEPDTWRSDAANAPDPDPVFSRQEVPLETGPAAAAIVVNALTGLPGDRLVSDVVETMKPVTPLSKLLLLQADSVVRDKNP
jgi:hypothetical protein